jgi:DNA-binding PadR family transcriptional regulator
MGRQPRSNPLALAVLVCLYERPMHPYDVAQTLRSRAKHESVKLNYGSLYAVVESLEKRGLVAARETVREGRRPERTVYEITDLGRRETLEWMTDIVAGPVKEYPQFLAALTFIGALPPDDALAALRQRVVALELNLAKLRGQRRLAADAGLPRLFALEGEYEEAMVAAELDFVQRLVKDMESGALEGLDMWRMFHTEAFDPEEVALNFTFGVLRGEGPAD